MELWVKESYGFSGQVSDVYFPGCEEPGKQLLGRFLPF